MQLSLSLLSRCLFKKVCCKHYEIHVVSPCGRLTSCRTPMHCTLAGPTSSHNSSFIYCSLTLRQSDGRVTKESNDLILFDSRQPSDCDRAHVGCKCTAVVWQWLRLFFGCDIFKSQFCRTVVGIRFQSPYAFHTHRKTCMNPHRIPVPTKPRNPPYPYPYIPHTLCLLRHRVWGIYGYAFLN